MVRARKRFGQHFLEPQWVDKLIAAIAPQPDETFLEIGPGRGALTLPLAARARHVVAFEIDRDLAAALRAADIPNLTIVEGDFLEATADQLQAAMGAPAGRSSVRVAANLPYNVASPILFKLQELRASGIPLADATVMLQREVAERLTARPGTKEYGVLTILIGQQADVRRLFTLPPGAFRPVPKVHSAVVRLDFHAPDPPAAQQRIFEELVQAIFTRRRKMIANALAAFKSPAAIRPVDALASAGIDARRRPESLTLQELARLADMFI